MDIWSKAKRSIVMARIRGRDTKPELLLRSLLHRSGLRYSLRAKGLPGRPDIVLPKYRTVIFVHGCFWHQHRGCPVAAMPKTRAAFWAAKFEANVRRDRVSRAELRRRGWRVIVVWECEVLKDPAGVLKRVRHELGVGQESGYRIPERGVLLKVAEARLQYGLAGGAAGASDP